MKYGAHAVTTSSGRQAVLGAPTDTLHIDQSVGQKGDPWLMEVKQRTWVTLGELLSNSRYALLARHLYDAGYNLHTTCGFCTHPGYLKDVQIDPAQCVDNGIQYRIYRGRIYKGRTLPGKK